MKRLLAVITLVVLVAVPLGGCSDANSSESRLGAGRMHANALDDAEESTSTESAPVKEDGMHVSDVKLTGTETAVMKTSKGTITLEFYPEDAPNTVASFVELAESGFYDGLKFHRVVPTFVIQGGDPLTRDLSTQQLLAGVGGAGTGGPGWNQKAEFNTRKHERGTLAMARSQAIDSAGSQFYICLEPQPSLDGKYTVFGRVVDGIEVIDQIAVGDVIESVTIQR